MANININPYGSTSEVPAGYPIANDLETDNAQVALSAAMGVKLNRKGSMFYALNMLSYEQLSKNITDAPPHSWSDNSYNYVRRLIPVAAGETYKITTGGEAGRMAVLTSNSTTGNAQFATGYSAPVAIDAESSIEFIIPADGTYLYVAKPASVEKLEGPAFEKYKMELPVGSMGEIKRVFISTANNQWYSGAAGGYRCVLIPVSSGQRFKIKANANYIAYFAVLDNNNTFVSGDTASYATGWTKPRKADPGVSDYITIPQDGAFLYINTSWGDTKPFTNNTPLLWRLFDNDVDLLKAGLENRQPHIPKNLVVGNPTNIIYTIDDFLMAHEGYDDNNGGTLKFSLDLGKTWKTLANTFGNITNAFLFNDGTLMFCAKKSGEQSKAFWIRDFENMTVNECTILDYNGQPFVSETDQTRLYNVGRVTHHEYANGVEYFCFGDYNTTFNWTPRLWYSCDNGRTIRCAFAFGVQQINGSVVNARHIHWFCYNKYDGYFYALTGDHASESRQECHIMRGRHDANHVWTWELLKTGQAYKLVSPAFDEGNMYAVTDYTDTELTDAMGIVSLPISSLDVADMRYLFRASSEFMAEGSSSPTAAIASYLCDNHGWRIAGTDYKGNSKLLIAKGGHNFVWVDNDKLLKFGNWMGPNNNGDCYATFTEQDAYSSVGMRISHRQSYNVTEMFRNSGMTDFCEGWKGTTY